MNKTKKLILLAVVSTIGLLFASCDNSSCEKKTDSPATKKIEVAKDKSGKEYTSAYICPMYCKGSGSDQAGKCPACEMDYVVNKNKVSDTESTSKD